MSRAFFVNKMSLRDLNISGKKVLMRVDFNVPLNEDGSIRDATRIALTLPSIQYVLSQKGRLILMSHLGRPKKSFDEKLSLKPCAKKLTTLLGQEVRFCPDCIGNVAKKMVEHLKPGEVLLLENLRFYEGEEWPEKDPSFTQALAELGDVYINDAFGAAHRSHASTASIAHYFGKNCGMGFLMEKEVEAFSKIIFNPTHPFYATIGGAKIESKIEILQSLSKKVDAFFIGGGMAFPFLKARGFSIGDAVCNQSALDFAHDFLIECEQKGIAVHLPIDVVVTNEKVIETVPIQEGISSGWKVKDIGPQTVKTWSEAFQKAATVFWNGPMGVFEISPFDQGTHDLAKDLSKVSANVLIGGGDLVAAVHSLKLEGAFSHVSSGGGASLELIAREGLPGIEALASK